MGDHCKIFEPGVLISRSSVRWLMATEEGAADKHPHSIIKLLPIFWRVTHLKNIPVNETGSCLTDVSEAWKLFTAP